MIWNNCNCYWRHGNMYYCFCWWSFFTISIKKQSPNRKPPERLEQASIMEIPSVLHKWCSGSCLLLTINTLSWANNSPDKQLYPSELRNVDPQQQKGWKCSLDHCRPLYRLRLIEVKFANHTLMGYVAWMLGFTVYGVHIIDITKLK